MSTESEEQIVEILFLIFLLAKFIVIIALIMIKVLTLV
jgi:hypothetical protein